MRLFLVRHGESIQNVGKSNNIADHKVCLTEHGREQARKSAEFFKEYLMEQPFVLTKSNTRVWTGPYVRTKETCGEFDKVLGFRKSCIDILEDISLTEQQFAVFDSSWGVNRDEKYPIETEYIRQLREQNGKFWVRYPLGESPFDVACRVKNFLGTIFRDYDRHGIENLVIFTHGVTLRTLVMQYMHYTVDWYENEHNPGNCWIRYIDDSRENQIDKGYIYKGEG